MHRSDLIQLLLDELCSLPEIAEFLGTTIHALKAELRIDSPRHHTDTRAGESLQ